MPGFMAHQKDITVAMRAILVDWLVEVSDEFKLQPETFYLAVSYTDRYLSREAVPRSKLQLVGATCMFLAAKYEEIYPPTVGEFAYITDDTYSPKQVTLTPDGANCMHYFLTDSQDGEAGLGSAGVSSGLSHHTHVPDPVLKGVKSGLRPVDDTGPG